MEISCVETADGVDEVIVRRNAFNQEVQTVRADYPPIFQTFFKVFEVEELTQTTLQKRFRALCRRLREALIEGRSAIEKPASKGSGGRLSREEDNLRNEFRRNVYILVREIEGQKWWPHVDGLIKRQTAGKRPTSPVAKSIADLLHFILREKEEADPAVLDNAAIVDMANQLAYALRHEVPFRFLIGFLLEVRFDKAAQKERAGEWEEWRPSHQKVAGSKSAQRRNTTIKIAAPRNAGDDDKSARAKRSAKGSGKG